MSCGLPSELMISTRFPIVDLAVSGALEGSEDLVEHVLTYDVGCEYIAKILARWDQWKLPPEQKKISARQAQYNADNDLWEANRMVTSGVATRKEIDLDFEDESE